MITSRMSHPSAPHTLRRFFDRVVHRSFGDLAFGHDPAADIGDYTLFMTGLFRERVERMSVTGFYIREGQRSYRFVSEHDRADARPEARLFRALADRFEGYASALHYMRKVYYRPEHGPPDLPFFRRLVTEW